jgi:NAD(P)-dependent dehydrogenase (short-subunit alcohol dehydrogenase family)
MSAVFDLSHGNKPSTSTHPPPDPPSGESEQVQKKEAATFLGTTKRLPEFNLVGRVVLVSGAARGLGLTQAEALLEAGATVYALDILPEPSPDFPRIQKRAAEELGTTLHYRHVDVRDNEGLNKVVKEIADAEGRMDGLIAAAGIQKEMSALEYTQEDANHMFSINITGVFMTCQAVAKQMIRFKRGGSIVMIGSMSAHVANKV